MTTRDVLAAVRAWVRSPSPPEPSHAGPAPLSADWQKAMRRGGDDCNCRDHHDALRKLGQTLQAHQDLIADYQHLWELHRAITAERDEWRRRALYAEHPSSYKPPGSQKAA